MMEVNLTTLKVSFISFIFMFLYILSCLLFNITVAEEEYYEIRIVEKDYDIIRIKEINNRTVVYFNINITLHNLGNLVSEDITVKIEDEDGWYVRNDTLQPHESKKFIFDNHPLLGSGEHRINISYYPTNKNVVLTDYNHGEDVLFLLSENKNNFTPGFEVGFLIITIVVYVLISKYNK